VFDQVKGWFVLADLSATEVTHKITVSFDIDPLVCSVLVRIAFPNPDFFVWL
jgi:hypothetical protein